MDVAETLGQLKALAEMAKVLSDAAQGLATLALKANVAQADFIRYDKNNPRWNAAMFTGVNHNTAGSKASSLTDEEAVALWDAVMATMRLRVPGR